MSNTMDNIFSREFKEMMNTRKGMAKGLNIQNIPIPPYTSQAMSKGLPKYKSAKVKKIAEPYFDRLNNTEAFILSRMQLKKRQVLSNGTFRKDKEGKYVTDDVSVPNGSVAILSPISIGLKNYTLDKRGKKVKHVPSQGFKYVDFVNYNNQRHYIYIVPKDYVYRLNVCALVLTPNKRRNFYKGYKLALQNGTYAYLYVIPYTYRDQVDLKILGVKATFEFTQEINQTMTFWMQKGVLFNLALTNLENNVNGKTNLGYEELEGTIITEDYVQTNISLKDEKADDLQEQY